MQMPDVITIISEDPEDHGVHDTPALSGRELYVLVRSVGMSERYQAMANGFNPSIVFTLRDASDYNGEKIILHNGRRMRVVRTYQTGRGIELTCEELTVDAEIMNDYREADEDA